MSNDFEYNDSNYLDYVSTQDIITEGKVTVKDLIKDAYDMALPLIHRLMYIEADFIYLNLVCGVPQTTIAEIYGLSQLGVSKRVRGGVKKLKQLLEVPETNIEIVKSDFYNLLPKRCREVALLYYKSKMFIHVSTLIGEPAPKIRSIVQDSIDILDRFIQSKGKDCARLTENPYDEYKDKQAYRQLLKDPDELDTEILKAERYSAYFKDITKQFNYGNFHFKAASRDFAKDGSLDA